MKTKAEVVEAYLTAINERARAASQYYQLPLEPLRLAYEAACEKFEVARRELRLACGVPATHA